MDLVPTFIREAMRWTSLCIASKYWPQTAQPWIARCQLKQWPTQTLLREILFNGCHVMPIGSKLIDDDSELEWRLFFSSRTKPQSYSISLLWNVEIIFKRGFELETQASLICSYFMKTILFWEIQNNPDDAFWCSSNLLFCFWVYFKRLCKGVLDAYCPNFFIPENQSVWFFA